MILFAYNTFQFVYYAHSILFYFILFYFIYDREIKDLFCEIIEIKNPSSSLERKKIVELANEQINYRFMSNLNEKLKRDNIKVIKTENNNEIDNSDNNINDIIIPKKDFEILKINIDTINEISDILSGLASYSLFVEAIRLLKISASKITINHQNKINLSDKKNSLLKNDNATINENVTKTIDENKNNKTSDDKNKRNIKNEKWNLSFPFVYGQTYAKQALLEALLWPRKYSLLYRTLSPSG